MDILELLDKFRRKEYHYPDVVWHEIRAEKLRMIVAEKLVDMTRDEFRSLLLGNLFMPARIPEQATDDIVTRNDFNQVKLRIFDLFFGQKSIKERLQSVLNLTGVGPYIASQLLAAVGNDEYTVYHPNVIEGINDLLHHLVEWDLIEQDVSTAEQYLGFNEVCKSIKKVYGFKSLGEVHEFFWHGHDSNWRFDRQ